MKQRTERRASARPEAWKGCTVCRQIPQTNFALWIDGELSTGPLPAQADQLATICAPLPSEQTYDRRSCLKRCPGCGSYYLWEYTHQATVPSCEDVIELIRLQAAEGRTIHAQLEERFQQAQEIFERDATARLEELATSRGAKAFGDTGAFVRRGQGQGFDLAFAVDGLVQTLVHHPHQEVDEVCRAGRWYLKALCDLAADDGEQAGRILDLIARQDLAAAPPELLALKQACEQRQGQPDGRSGP